MKSGAKIIISTPNFDSLSAKVFREFWYALDTPRHLFLFAPKTISLLLSECGFEVKKIEYSSTPKVVIRSLYYLFGKRDLKINPFIWRIFKPISMTLSKFGMTSIMIIYAKKK